MEWVLRKSSQTSPEVTLHGEYGSALELPKGKIDTNRKEAGKDG